MSNFEIFGGKSAGKLREYYFVCIFNELVVCFKGILMPLSLFIVFYCLSCFVANFGIGGNYALFGVRFFRLKFGWCKESDIFHVCEYPHK